MPEIHNTEQMQASIKEILAYLSRELPDAIQNMAAPRFVACDFEEKTLELAFEIQPWMRNPANILHGGLTAMMLDTTMGTLSRCYARGEGITPTITMEVSYLLPIPVGSTLHVRAHAAHTGRAVNNLTAEAWVASTPGKLAATASGAFYSAGAEPGAVAARPRHASPHQNQPKRRRKRNHLRHAPVPFEHQHSAHGCNHEALPMQCARLKYGSVEQGQHHRKDQPHAYGAHAIQDVRKSSAFAEPFKAGSRHERERKRRRKHAEGLPSARPGCPRRACPQT